MAYRLITPTMPTLTAPLSVAEPTLWSAYKAFTAGAARPTQNYAGPSMIPGPAGLADDTMVVTTSTSSQVMPYAVLFFVWTAIVGAGLAVVWVNRQRKATKLRDWRSIAVAVMAIQILFGIDIIAAWIPDRIGCAGVYWIVSLLIPSCLAAYQIPNARLVSYYLANKNNGMALMSATKGNRTWRYWTRMAVIERTYLTVIAGLVCQFLFTTLLYFGSRRFHDSYGLWGKHEDEQNCFYGFEWVVSILWQVIFAYGTGFVLLREIRHVKDVYHWARETRIVIFASMPGPLLWMVFMFLDNPTVRAVNAKWPPRNWLVPGMVMIQVILISFPLWDACKSDAKHKASLKHNSIYGPGTSIDSMLDIINQHSQPVIDYAASTRFNAELIIFLRDVKKWRMTWITKGADWAISRDREERVACYKHAALIYFKLVHLCIATFTINVDARINRALGEEFKYARYVGKGKVSLGHPTAVAPWESVSGSSSSNLSSRTSPTGIKGLKITLAEAEATVMLITPETLDAASDNLDEIIAEGINIASYFEHDAPDTFTLRVFDGAYKAVKQEAYHNMWLPYVKCGKFARDFKASNIA